MEILFISETMENKDIYYNYILNIRLNRKYFIYDGVKYKIELGHDILRLINHRKKINRTNQNYNRRHIK